MLSGIGGDHPDEYELCRKRKQRGFSNLPGARILRERNGIGRFVNIRVKHVPALAFLEGYGAMPVFAFRAGKKIREIRFGIVRREA